MKYALSRKALRDFAAIWDYIAEDSVSSADQFADELVKHFQLLGENPYIGRRCDELGRAYRRFVVREYLIFYSIEPPGIRIAHVIHGRRDLESALED